MNVVALALGSGSLSAKVILTGNLMIGNFRKRF